MNTKTKSEPHQDIQTLIHLFKWRALLWHRAAEAFRVLRDMHVETSTNVVKDKSHSRQEQIVINIK